MIEENLIKRTDETTIFDILCCGCCYKYPPKDATEEDIWENCCGWCFRRLWHIEKCHNEMDWRKHFRRKRELRKTAQ